MMIECMWPAAIVDYVAINLLDVDSTAVTCQLWMK